MAETETAPKTPRKRAAPKAAATKALANNQESGQSSKTSVIDKAKQAGSTLADEAISAARNAANQGKDRASEALSGVSKAVEGAATLVEEKVGAQYGGYARKAADKVSGIAETLKSKDIDEVVADTRDFVRKRPAIAVAIAAAVGFVLTRLIKIGGSDREGA